MKQPLKIRLHTISPIHIGCDDVYEPTSFVIDEKKGKLIEFDPMDFIKSLSSDDRERFTALCMQGNISSIVSIYKFISGRQVIGREIEITRELSSHYKKVRDLPTNNERKIKQELSQFTISRTAYNPHNNLPYIPGSSLKGSLRTAYLSKLAKDKGVRDRKSGAKDLEKELLGGSFRSDPFRMVKVSDFLPVDDVKTKIVYAVNKKKKTSKFPARGPFQILETIQEGAVFEGMINILQPEKLAGIKRPVTTEELLKSIYDFYISRVNEESQVAKEINISTIVASRINEKFKDKLGKTAFLLRIGRHSGGEAITLEGNRHIKIMQAKGQSPKFLDHATTFWLASDKSKPNTNNGLIPFGWTILEITGIDEETAKHLPASKPAPIFVDEKADFKNSPFASLQKKQDEKHQNKDKKKKLNEGDKVSGECFEKDGKLKIKISGNQGEIIAVPGSYIPWSPGQKVKVRIDKMSQDGKILKIRP